MPDHETQRLTQADRPALRDLADAGNGNALERLADLADLAEQREDVGELSDLLGEGSEAAGEYLTARAIAVHDLRELQRLADEGVERAEAALAELLS